MPLSDSDRVRISAAIRAAEARTSGEIVCVLAETSTGVTALPVLIAAVLALALPWLLVATTALTVQRILEFQVVAFVLLAVVLSLPRLRVALLPRAARRALAHRSAMEQFRSLGISRKRDRAGILIFVSLAERYARIVADEGIAARVRQPQWQAAVDTLIAHMREGRVADGFISGIDACADVLATHFPLAGPGKAELPDRIYVI